MSVAYGACSDSQAKYAGRISVLVDAKGCVERVFDSVDCANHPSEVLALIS